MHLIDKGMTLLVAIADHCQTYFENVLIDMAWTMRTFILVNVMGKCPIDLYVVTLDHASVDRRSLFYKCLKATGDLGYDSYVTYTLKCV